MGARRVAVLDLGRAAAMGEQRRVRSWVETLAAAGVEALVIGLTEEHPARPAAVLRGRGAVVVGSAVPETMAWQSRAVRERLVKAQSDAVILVSARAYHPCLVGV